MKPSITITPVSKLLRACATLACALAPGLAAQTTAESTAPGQAGDGFRTLYHYERRSAATPQPLNTARAVFSDTGSPGTLKITAPASRLEIQGIADGAGGAVSASSTIALKNPGGLDAEGFRRLDTVADFELVEKNNIVTLNVTQGGDRESHAFKIQVPRDTRIVIENENITSFTTRSVTITDVGGDVNINLRYGDITLQNTTAAVSATTGLGMITAEFSATPEKPLNLNAYRNITLALPAGAAASLRMNARFGDIRTNFSDDALKITSTTASFASTGSNVISDNKRLEAVRSEIARRRQERGAGETGYTPPASAAEPSDDFTAENERLALIREEIARRRQQRDVGAVAPASVPPPPRAIGGVVTGELNGGGVDIRLTTSSGTITLKQAK